MRRYMALQLKRVWKVFPFVLGVLLVMLVCAAVVVTGFVGQKQSSEENRRFKIALTGDTDGELVQLGILALKNFDDTRFSMELIEMEESEAAAALQRGEIAAYAVLPERFIERAWAGDIDTVRYVTTAVSENVATLFKNEVTQIITDMVVYNEKGIYALADVNRDHGDGQSVDSHIDALAFAYADLIFSRSEMCYVEELGISNGVGLAEYYVCGIAVIFLTLIGVSFVTVYVKNDHSLHSLLASKGYAVSTQVLCESVPHFLMLLALSAVLIAAGAVACIAADLVLPYAPSVIVSFVLRLLAVVVMVAAFNILMFEISGNVVTAVLIYFLGCIGQCYVTGCFYPVYALPLVLQRVAGWLPWGIAREYLEGAFVSESRFSQLIGMVLFTVLFAVITVFLRRKRTGVTG